MKQTIQDIHQRFTEGFRKTAGGNGETRIGAELKFPIVDPDGAAASWPTVQALFNHLAANGWSKEVDTLTGKVVGARKPGERNDTVASYETGYCKTEFSMAHVGNLSDLERAIAVLRSELAAFSEKHNVFFLGYGIHPVTPPSGDLLMKKERSSFWHKVFPSNRVIPPGQGDDVNLFTVNTASHVHISVPPKDAIEAVNVLNGFAGPTIALVANSSIWRGAIDPDYKCVSEKLWDWWAPAEGRVGVPPDPFCDLEHYLEMVLSLRPVYVKRESGPVILKNYRSFLDYYSQPRAVGHDLDGNEVPVTPRPEDIEVHNSCYWFNARVSRYYTVESRVCDQQPPEALLLPAALTLGLVEALDEGWEALSSHPWSHLVEARSLACARGPAGLGNGLWRLARDMAEVAEIGLKKRGLGEERFLEPLKQRIEERSCPAIKAEAIFEAGGISRLLDEARVD